LPASFTYIPTPTITGITPNSGPIAGGTSVTITGTNLTGGTFTFGGLTATCTVAAGGLSATCTSPAHAAGPVDVVVTTGGGSGAVAGGFTYLDAPTITGITPNSGPIAGGTSVTITGTNLTGGTFTFGGLTATCTVAAGGLSATCTSPAHAAGPVDVVVTTPGGTATLPASFTYIPTPTITGITPNSGPVAGGTSVTITGTGLTDGTFTFGGLTATCTVAAGGLSATCTTPAHAAGPVDVVVTTGGGSGAVAGGFTYIPTPTITGIKPISGPVAGGTSVTITGTGLTGGTFTFGGLAATCTVAAGGLSATCVTPAHAAGPVDVVVTTPNGAFTLPSSFTYIITNVTISGNAAGIPGVTLTYVVGGITKTVTSGAGGVYTITVASGWSGTVTPSKAGYADFYIPQFKPYTNVTANKVKQNYGAQVTFRPGVPNLDGYVTESAFGSNIGGTIKAKTSVFWVGDTAKNQRYAGILSFNTAKLPDVPITVSSVLLKIKLEKTVGTNPFTYGATQNLTVALKKGNFGLPALEKTDFQAAATVAKASTFTKTATAGWYKATFLLAGKNNVNRAGNTQLRLKFDINKANATANYLSFYSGLATVVANRPYLIFTYLMP
jgi:hypothetical protein